MFANIFMLSLLTIIYGTKGDEGGGGNVAESAINFLPELSRQQSSDELNFEKMGRALRTPFRNTEISTARGFGKRDDEENFIDEIKRSRPSIFPTQLSTARGFGKRDEESFMDEVKRDRSSLFPKELSTARGFGKRGGGENYLTQKQQSNDDYRDEVITNLIRQKPLLFPFNNNQFMRNPPIRDEYVSQDNGIVPIVSAPVVKNHRLQIRDGTLKFRLNDGNLRIGRGFGKRSGYDPLAENFRAIQLMHELSNQNQQFSPILAYSSLKDDE